MAIYRTSSRLRQKTYTSNQEGSSFIEDVFFPNVQYLNPDKLFSGDWGDEVDSDTFCATEHEGYIYVGMAVGGQSNSILYLVMFKIPKDGGGQVESFSHIQYTGTDFVTYDSNDNYLNGDDITFNVNLSGLGNYGKVDFDTTTDTWSYSALANRNGTQLDADIDYLGYNYECEFTAYRADSNEEPLVPLLKVTKL